jgi:hypothetical protein
VPREFGRNLRDIGASGRAAMRRKWSVSGMSEARPACSKDDADAYLRPVQRLLDDELSLQRTDRHVRDSFLEVHE